MPVAHLVLDEWPRRWMRRARDGEQWFWDLDANEVPQYTMIEALVRDIVDLAEQAGIPVMRHGALWWVRSVHVHPRCRGELLGVRLLVHARWSVIRGPLDLVVLEAHPEPTMFAPPGTTHPDSSDRTHYGRPSTSAVQGLVRYFGRLGFARAEQIAREFQRVANVGAEDEGHVSRKLGIGEYGPGSDRAAVPMFAFAGNLRAKGAPRLGVRVDFGR